MSTTVTVPALCETDPAELQRVVQTWRKGARDRYPDAVLDAVRALTEQDPMPYLAPARKHVKAQLRTMPRGRVTDHRDPVGDTAVRGHILRTLWRAALAKHLPDTIPARALDNLAIICAHA